MQITGRFKTFALCLGGIGVVAALVGSALLVSLPHRIGPSCYTRYLWASRVSLAAFVIPFVAMVMGGIAREPRAIALAGASFITMFLVSGGNAVRSGPNPQAWCCSNLKSLWGAKEQFAMQNDTTNGLAITKEQISQYVDGGFASLKCCEHGEYILGPAGAEPRCSVHGSMTEIEARAHRRGGNPPP